MAEPMTPSDRWFLSDCEGRLEIWREAALRHVTRDEDGEITGYRLPAVYKGSDLIASWDLSTWDEGQDEVDDARRRVYAEIVRRHNEADEVERLRAELDDARADARRFLGKVTQSGDIIAALQAKVATLKDDLGSEQVRRHRAERERDEALRDSREV